MSKGDFAFAAATQIPYLLNELDKKCFAVYTPCKDMDREKLIDSIAVVHGELILVHPFREGHGRLSRLLADVMAVQAGYQPLDYSSWDADKERYFVAIHHGLDCDYMSMLERVRVALR